MINVIICGLGKMGKAVANLVADSQDLHIFGAIEAPDSPLIGQEVFKLIRGDSGYSSVSVYSRWNDNWFSGVPLLATSFATPSATMEHAEMCYDRVYSRHGKDCKRQPGQIGIQAVRAGDIIGNHKIIIAGAGQRIELNHFAHSRDNFASGVIKAIRWVAGEKPGFYNMQDVMGLR